MELAARCGSPRIRAGFIESEEVIADHAALVVEGTRRGNGGEDATGAFAPNGFRADAGEESRAHHIMDEWPLALRENAGGILVRRMLEIPACLRVDKILHGCQCNAFGREIIARVATCRPEAHEPIAERRCIGEVERTGFPVRVVPHAAVVRDMRGKNAIGGATSAIQNSLIL